MNGSTKDIYILAIESSCDETAAAVVKNGRQVLSNIISSQIALHTLYGGVVPELASRKHIEKIDQVVAEALRQADKKLEEMDAVAVTYGPGLVGALLVGVAYAKSLAYAAGLPLVGVHHIEGHVSANYISHPELEPPFLCLIVSGGHTHLVKVKDYGVYEIIGRTHDDAAGEAFDKVARAVGLGYPGGPKIDRCAREGNPEAIAFPRAHIDGCPYDFSFSGVKSAVLNYLNQCEMKERAGRMGTEPSEELLRISAVNSNGVLKTATKDDGTSNAAAFRVPDVAASFQKAVVDVLVEKTINAAVDFHFPQVAIAGGVASNSGLRAAMQEACDKKGLKLMYPDPILCTDNAAMIGAAGYYEFINGRLATLELNAVPNLKIGTR